MFIRIVLSLSPEERNALVTLAEKELRSPRDQIRVILRQALNDSGLLAFNKEIAAPDYLCPGSGSASTDMPPCTGDTSK